MAASLSPGECESVYRRNYPFFVGDFIVFGVAISLIGGATVIPDFVRKLTDSEILIALSGQMFEIGWLMPQLLMARWLMRVANKKLWFVIPNIPVRLVVLILAGTIVLLGPDRRAEILAVFLVLYGLAALGDGLVGVPWVDLVGSSLDDRRRSQLFGLGNASVGVLMLGFSQVVRLILSDDGPAFPNNYALLFGISGALFVITIPMPMFIRELPGGKPRETAPTVGEYRREIQHVMRSDKPFRALVIVRALTALVTLATPFYIGFATEELNLSSDVAVSRLMLMQTLGSVAGSLVLARLGDRYVLPMIRIALLIGLLPPLMALVAGVAGPVPLYIGFLALGVVAGCLYFSFLNWMIMYATPEQRPMYSGLLNTVSAVALLAAPFVGGSLVEVLGYESVFVAALAIMGAAVVVGLRDLPAPRK